MNGDGFLTEQSWQSFVANGVLSANASVDVFGPLFVDAALPGPLYISLNDQPIPAAARHSAFHRKAHGRKRSRGCFSSGLAALHGQ